MSMLTRYYDLDGCCDSWISSRKTEEYSMVTMKKLLKLFPRMAANRRVNSYVRKLDLESG